MNLNAPSEPCFLKVVILQVSVPVDLGHQPGLNDKFLKNWSFCLQSSQTNWFTDNNWLAAILFSRHSFDAQSQLANLRAGFL